MNEPGPKGISLLDWGIAVCLAVAIVSFVLLWFELVKQ